MWLLRPIASIFGLELDAMTDRLKRTLIFTTIIAAFCLLATIFLIVAGYLALSSVFGPVIAALVMAGGALVLALAVYLGSRIGERERQRLELERRRKAEANAVLSTAAVTAVPAILRSPLGRTVGLPLLAVGAFLMLRGRGGAD
jgi:hypothetical protein